jgi:DNA-binding response OmpR family regulator
MAEAAHVVIVDDEPDLRETVREYLLSHGYAVSAVADGAALRELLSRRPVDLAILDIGLPGEDGLSLARFLRGQGSVGIVMLTASAATVDRVVGLEVGADDYVAKPFDLRELLARVRSVLRRAAAASAPRAVLGR